MALTQVVDVTDTGTGHLISQYQNKPRFAAWLASYLDQVQELEDATWGVIIQRLIDNAEGVQLDTIGDIVGEPRKDRDDPTYRVFIAVRIMVNRSEGHASDLLDVLAILEATTPFLYYEPPPANMLIEFSAPTFVDPAELLSILRDAKAGGVGLVLIAATDATLDFEYSDANDGGVHDALDHAWGDANALDQTFGLMGSVYA
jgi:hypothetical protein